MDIGIPGQLMSNLYVCPLYNFNVGLGVCPSGVKRYDLLSKLSTLVTVYVLTNPFACPTTGILNGPFSNQ